ncbi:MAG: cation:proton antiporter [Chloroflexota bacterium]
MTPGIDEEIPHVLELLVGLLGVAVVVAILVRPLRLPYTVALVIAGLLAGLLARLAGYPPVDVSPELVLLVLLPGLVFEAAYRLRLTEIRRWFGGLLLLAIPGVVISAAVVAVVLSVATGLRLDLAFIVGAMVSATDPAAVIATFKRLTVPRALSTMVDGESLLNDGTGLVLFAIAVSAVYAPVSPLGAVTSFIGIVSVSVLIGLATGFAAAWVFRFIADDHLIELTLTVVLAYGSYVLADQVGLSGVIATVTAGIVLGNVGINRDRADDAADAIDTVWEFIAYLLTAFVFLLVGLAIPPVRLLDSVVPIAWGILAILLGRAFVVYVLLGGSSRLAVRPGLADRIPGSWLHVLFWSGLRGAVAVAMALSLPLDIPERPLLQEITFGIILFTLLIQGTTIGWVVDHTVRGDSADLPDRPAPVGR